MRLSTVEWVSRCEIVVEEEGLKGNSRESTSIDIEARFNTKVHKF